MYNFVRANQFKIINLGTSLVVQWLRLHTCNAGGMGSIPGIPKIPHAMKCSQIIAVVAVSVIRNLPIREYSISCHLFRSSFKSSNKALVFSSI